MVVFKYNVMHNIPLGNEMNFVENYLLLNISQKEACILFDII